MAARLETGMEADAELGDDVGSFPCIGDELAEHLGRLASVDRNDTSAFESQCHRGVDEPFHGVGDSQIGDEYALGAVLVRRDEDLAAREVVSVAGLEG